MRRLIAVAFVLVGACASAGAPPGGPERHTPPEITMVSVDSGQVNVKAKAVEFHFDEVVSDRPAGGTALDQIFLISPRTGVADVSWHRTRISVRPKNGFRDNTAYRITMLPGLVDLRGNARKDTRTVLFSTGPDFPAFQIRGRVFDWNGQRPAAGAYVEAISHPDTTIVYITATDTLGQYDVGPLPTGVYTVRALIDANNNRTVDRNEKWDSVTVNVAGTSPGSVELDAIERDSVPASIESVATPDSVTIRLTFDKAIDPAVSLQPALVRVQRADSSELQVTRIQWQSAFDAAKQTLDSARRADSLRTADTTKAASPAAARPAAPVGVPTGARPAPAPPKPRTPAPDRSVVITLSSTTRLVPGDSYRITAHGMRNIAGNARDATRIFTVPKPEPKPAAKPATKPATTPPPVDSARTLR